MFHIHNTVYYKTSTFHNNSFREPFKLLQPMMPQLLSTIAVIVSETIWVNLKLLELSCLYLYLWRDWSLPFWLEIPSSLRHMYIFVLSTQHNTNKKVLKVIFSLSQSNNVYTMYGLWSLYLTGSYKKLVLP